MVAQEIDHSSPASGKPSKTRRAINIVLLCIAIAYLGFYVARQWPVVLGAIARFRIPDLLAATILLISSLALNAVYHVIAIRRLGNENQPAGSRIIAAYAAAQLVRYLPGKVLGVVYEAGRLADSVPAYRVVAANVAQGLYTNAMTVGVLTTAGVWIYSGNTVIALGVLVIAFAALWATHRFHIAERCLAWATRRIPRLRSHLTQASLSANRGALPASLLLLTEWIPYYAFWSILLGAADATMHRVILLGSCYAGASLIANLTVVMPSGLIVREALFLWAGTQLSIDAPSLIVFGMISRLVFTFADAAFVPLAWLYDKLLSSAGR